MELTNQVLLHICKEFDVQPADKEMGVNEELTKNDIYALQYLPRYIFHKFYKKFKQQLKNNEIYMQYCSILSAGKVHQDEERYLSMQRTKKVCGKLIVTCKICFY